MGIKEEPQQLNTVNFEQKPYGLDAKIFSKCTVWPMQEAPKSQETRC